MSIKLPAALNGLFPTTTKPAQVEIPYENYGYIPGIAQAAQNGIYPNPHLNPQPYFNTDQLAVANWFTTRVHLSPLGKV
jgi:hypothetical protein